MKKIKKKTTKDKKVKLHDCKFVQFFYDNLDRGKYCDNTSNSGKVYCDCNDVLIRNHCPFFVPNDGEELEITIRDDDRKALERYREHLRCEVREMLNTVHRYLPRINKITEVLTGKPKELI